MEKLVLTFFFSICVGVGILQLSYCRDTCLSERTTCVIQSIHGRRIVPKTGQLINDHPEEEILYWKIFAVDYPDQQYAIQKWNGKIPTDSQVKCFYNKKTVPKESCDCLN